MFYVIIVLLCYLGNLAIIK